jgi:hypothetical protein
MMSPFAFFAAGFSAAAAVGTTMFGHPEFAVAPGCLAILNAALGFVIMGRGR